MVTLTTGGNDHSRNYSTCFSVVCRPFPPTIFGDIQEQSLCDAVDFDLVYSFLWWNDGSYFPAVWRENWFKILVFAFIL